MVTGNESQSPTGGVTNEALLEAIKGLSQRMDVMDGRIMNVEGRVSSSTSTPQPNYHATSSAHAQNTPSTISPNTLHQMFNPNQCNKPMFMLTNPRELLFDKFNLILIHQFKIHPSKWKKLWGKRNEMSLKGMEMMMDMMANRIDHGVNS